MKSKLSEWLNVMKSKESRAANPETEDAGNRAIEVRASNSFKEANSPLLQLKEWRPKANQNQQKLVPTPEKEWEIAGSSGSFYQGAVYSLESKKLVFESRVLLYFVYGVNDSAGREELLSGLGELGDGMDEPWLISRDFNCPLNLDNREGRVVTWSEIEPFRNFASSCGVRDLVRIGCKFTWNNKQQRLESWFNHSHVVIHLNRVQKNGRGAFKFLNMWSTNLEFENLVRDAWSVDIHGVKMYRITKKLKILKQTLKILHRTDFANIEMQFVKMKKELDEMQLKVHQGGYKDENLKATELKSLNEFHKEMYYSFLSQKAKIKWLQIGDENSSYFHRSLKMRRYRKSAIAIKDK
uniref:Uncharacterized protein n=1 Tax=Chenopodium quinoa TaxID=63459 RepID=A0A803MYM0_CHEQI